MLLYKLTDKNGKTRAGEENECQWGENITHKVKGNGTELCSDGFIHAYEDLLMAVFHDPIGGNYLSETDAQLWEAQGEVVIKDWGKVGCKNLTTIKRIPIPTLKTEQRVKVAIKCALAIYQDKAFADWANKWLSGDDRSKNAAAHAAYAAANAAANAAADAADAAAYAADTAANAAAHAAANAAANAAADAAYAAYAAANAAADAADAAAHAAADAAHAVAKINILKILKDTTEEES